MVRTLALALVLLGGCGGEDRREEARALVEQAFASAVRPGDFGTEVLGKGVWYRSPVFDPKCLQSKNLAFGDDPAKRGREAPRISPTYDAQRFFTASSEEGYCVLLGKDLKQQIGELEDFHDGAMLVNVTYTANDTTPFWKCLDSRAVARPVRVLLAEDGSLSIEGQIGLHQGGCPSPMPEATTKRKASTRPAAKPPGKPSVADARTAAKRFDDALWEHDARAAVDALSCFNLFEDKKYGTCATSEVLALGPITRGSPRLQDGPPWTMNAFKSFDDLGPISVDRKDPTMFHVQVAPARGKRKRRTMALQWAGGGWKLL